MTAPTTASSTPTPTTTDRAVPEPSRSGAALADGLLLAVAVFWGSSYVAAKSAVAQVPVFVFLSIRFLLTSLLLLPLIFARRGRWAPGTWRAGLVLGVLLFLVFSCETLGVAHTSPSNAGLLICLCVVLTPLLEGALRRAVPRAAILVAAGMSFVGAALLTARDGYRFNLGDLFILGAAVLRSAVMVTTKRLTDGKGLDSGLITVVQLATVAVLTTATAGLAYPAERIALPGSASFWMVTLYLCVFCTIFAFYVQTAMIRRTTPTRVGLIMGLEPVFATAFAVALWGEALSTRGWLGGALIVAATYLGLRAGA